MRPFGQALATVTQARQRAERGRQRSEGGAARSEPARARQFARKRDLEPLRQRVAQRRSDDVLLRREEVAAGERADRLVVFRRAPAIDLLRQLQQSVAVSEVLGMAG